MKERKGLIVTKSVKLQGYQSVSCRDLKFFLGFSVWFWIQPSVGWRFWFPLTVVASFCHQQIIQCATVKISTWIIQFEPCRTGPAFPAYMHLISSPLINAQICVCVVAESAVCLYNPTLTYCRKSFSLQGLRLFCFLLSHFTFFYLGAETLIRFLLLAAFSVWLVESWICWSSSFTNGLAKSTDLDDHLVQRSST